MSLSPVRITSAAFLAAGALFSTSACLGTSDAPANGPTPTPSSPSSPSFDFSIPDSMTPSSTPGSSAEQPASKTPTDPSRDLSFEAGAQLATTAEPVWSVDMGTLEDDGWSMDASRSDMAQGKWTYATPDGSTIVVLQQRVSDAQKAKDDESGSRMLLGAGAQDKGAEKTSLQRVGGGAVAVLAVSSSEGTSIKATITRVFARPGIALSLIITTPKVSDLPKAVEDAARAAAVLLE
ncbi:hypothetical protein E2R33_07875 [Rathayibacter toxicus]|uniref:hypothetical protein n=1 Tax=Rathayibacter toxicus TaxID=145458 RepID=UPI001C04104F|nr:hypothetical protein [Rathayibacter toxicus]QWL28523.1 hypothetical protein E2R33_07875 [Rathayibacter toxicus]